MRGGWAGALLLLAACGGGPERAEPARATAGGEGACVETAAASQAESEAEIEAEREAPPAEVRALADAPRRIAPPGTASIALLAEGRNAFVGRLEMEPNAAVPEHQDPDEEYIHVLEGRGTMWIDGAEYEVGPGTTIYMPAGATVRFQNGDARMVALQIFAGPGSAAKYERWTAAE